MALLRLRAPGGAELLAENDAARQAYRLGERTWGVQFHPEVTRHMLDYWFVEGEAELPDPARVQRETDANLAAWNAHGRRLCGAFLDVAARRDAGSTARSGARRSAAHSCQEPA